MNDRETARYDMFSRVGAFYANNTADFAPGSNAATHFTALAGIVTSLDAAKAGQINTGVTAKEVLIDALRLDVQNIARTAKAIAQDEPGFSDDFRAPASPSQAALLTTADNYLTHLAKPGVAAKFIANELPTDFVADLTADRAAIDDAKEDVESEDNEGVESTAAVGRLIKAGMKEVNYLNAIMHNKYSRTADKLVAWKSASHIERAPKRRKNLKLLHSARQRPSNHIHMDEPDQKKSEGEEAKASGSSTPHKKAPRSKKAGKQGPRALKKKVPKAKGGAKPSRKFPSYTLEDALQIPKAIKQFNAGNAWPPSEIGKALKIGSKGNRFWYLTAAAQDYGLTIGTSRSDLIELAPVGREIVYAPTPEIEARSIRDAFFKVEAFKKVFDYYQGGALPEVKYLANTLESVFNLPPAAHEEFHSLYVRNCTFLSSFGATPSGTLSTVENATKPLHSIVVGAPSAKNALRAFVIMPFIEKTPLFPRGFFEEVLKNLITPAAVEAGFRVETAKREGSDVIQSTIVNDLLEADLVIADLTEHNPNVLFELGLRMAFEKPIALIRAKGTPPIFDVDNLLRVLDYDPSLWKSTLEGDIPKMSGHVKGAWEQRETAMTYMKLLKKQ